MPSTSVNATEEAAGLTSRRFADVVGWLIFSTQLRSANTLTKQGIAANHMDMTKFSGKNDDGYQKVLGRLRDNIEWIDSLIPVKKSTELSKSSKLHKEKSIKKRIK